MKVCYFIACNLNTRRVRSSNFRNGFRTRKNYFTCTKFITKNSIFDQFSQIMKHIELASYGPESSLGALRKAHIRYRLKHVNQLLFVEISPRFLSKTGLE